MESSLQSYITSLEEKINNIEFELNLSERKCLRLELENSKAKTDLKNDSSPKYKAQDSNDQSNPEPATKSVEFDSLKVELEAMKLISEARLEELRNMEKEREYYKVNFKLLNDKFKLIPEDYIRDPRRIDALYHELTIYKSELKDMNMGVDSLKRQFQAALENQSQVLSSLEKSLLEKKFSISEFANGLEADNKRLRKDRDSMRELYESTNIQLSSLSKKNQHLLMLNDQLTVSGNIIT